jgi:hypothetical protein
MVWKGVSLYVFPAKRLRAGLGSKLSTWLVPPIMNSQMTFFALGGKWGLPSGGVQAPGPSGAAARTIPSRSSIVVSTSPVKPVPRLERKLRRDVLCRSMFIA